MLFREWWSLWVTPSHAVFQCLKSLPVSYTLIYCYHISLYVFLHYHLNKMFYTAVHWISIFSVHVRNLPTYILLTVHEQLWMACNTYESEIQIHYHLHRITTVVNKRQKSISKAFHTYPCSQYQIPAFTGTPENKQKLSASRILVLLRKRP